MKRIVWLMVAILSAYRANVIIPENESISFYLSYYILNPYNFFIVAVFLLFAVLIFSYTLRETLSIMVNDHTFAAAAIDILIFVGGIIFLARLHIIVAGLLIICPGIHLLLSLDKVKERDRQRG
ncbi:hypothetical protein EV207_102162 [Scopulibacillus darangshiensis]|uniref:Uncharacterized protein n=1 Tax=Scopulibacillus darangshiensis TaxID=442528 RepID=A0A4R2P9R3_9BACL|nr:hypothetical protein [Scopulibacillus darangshiensis]TCP31672.1 hypothetical protein EV207_102162 [Scopulibacillus darangshiensis]